jgi:hypothetical protein
MFPIAFYAYDVKLCEIFFCAFGILRGCVLFVNYVAIFFIYVNMYIISCLHDVTCATIKKTYNPWQRTGI